ncbi:MAG: EamA family transporter [Candidatus Limnocylindrales bacterium]
MNRVVLGTASVALAAALFGTLGYVTRNAAEHGMEALPFITWRGIVGTAALLLAAAVFGSVVSRRHRPSATVAALPFTRRRALVIAALLGAILNIAMFEAFNRTPIAVVLISFYTFPALVAIAAVPLYGERIDRIRAAALVLSAAGLALVVLAPILSGGAVTLDPIGIGLAIMAAFCQASFVLIAGRGFAPLPTVQVSAFVLFVAGAVAFVLALITADFAGLLVPFNNPDSWLWILAGGLTGAAIPTTAFIAGIGMIGPSRAAILMTIEPLVGVLLAGLFLGERPSPIQLAGGAAVLVAAAVLQVAPRHAPIPAEPDFGPIV